MNKTQIRDLIKKAANRKKGIGAGSKLRYEKNTYVIDYVVDKEYKGSDGFTRYILKVVKSNYPTKIKVGSTEEYESSRLADLMRNGVIKFAKNESVVTKSKPTGETGVLKYSKALGNGKYEYKYVKKR